MAGPDQEPEERPADDAAKALKGTDHPALSEGSCSDPQFKAALKDACKYKDWTTYGIVGTGVGVALVAITGYMAFGRGDSESAAKVGDRGKRVHKPVIAVTPIVQPNGGGAAFRIDW